MMHGMTGVPKVLDRSKIIRPDGSSLAQLPVLDCVELLAPLVEAVGHEETSGFKAMAEALGAGDTTVSTVAFRNAAGRRVIAAWGPARLRGMLHTKGAKLFLPALPASGTTGKQQPVA